MLWLKAGVLLMKAATTVTIAAVNDTLFITAAAMALTHMMTSTTTGTGQPSISDMRPPIFSMSPQYSAPQTRMKSAMKKKSVLHSISSSA